MNLRSRRRICSRGEADRVEGKEMVPPHSHLGHGGAAAAQRLASRLPSLRMRRLGDRGSRRGEGKTETSSSLASAELALRSPGGRSSPRADLRAGVSSRQSEEED